MQLRHQIDQSETDRTTFHTRRPSEVLRERGENNGISVESEDYGNAIAVSGSNLFIGGTTYSNIDFPWQADLINYPQAYYQPYNNSQFDFWPDGFLAQFVLTDTPLTVEEADSHDDSQITVFPNPTNGRLNVVIHGMKGSLELGLYDAIGQKVLTRQYNAVSNGQQLVLDLGQLPKGLYVLTYQSNEKPVNSAKIIVN